MVDTDDLKKRFWEKDTLFVKVPNPKEKGYSENSWFAVTGIPPNTRSASSTHLQEATGKVPPDVAVKLALLSNQKPPERIADRVVEKAKEELEKVT